MSKRAHYFQHVPFEGLGSIESWLVQAGYEISRTPFYEPSATIPAAQDIDLLIIMGGPMSVNEELPYPWLVEEKAFVRSVIALGKPVLGVCLGAQMIASAMGATVFANPVKEIGWFPIQSQLAQDSFVLPEQLSVFHWHGETFTLPASAKLLASSVACQHQVFQLGPRVLGLQCHLETTPETAKLLIDHCRDELVSDCPSIQSEADMLAAPMSDYLAMNDVMAQILTYLTRA